MGLYSGGVTIQAIYVPYTRYGKGGGIKSPTKFILELEKFIKVRDSYDGGNCY